MIHAAAHVRDTSVQILYICQRRNNPMTSISLCITIDDPACILYTSIHIVHHHPQRAASGMPRRLAYSAGESHEALAWNRSTSLFWSFRIAKNPSC